MARLSDALVVVVSRWTFVKDIRQPSVVASTQERDKAWGLVQNAFTVDN